MHLRSIIRQMQMYLITYRTVFHPLGISLDPVYMFSSTIIFSKTAHIQLPQIPANDGTHISNCTCYISASEPRQRSMAMTITLLYVDMPKATTCSQKLWVDDQDSNTLLSICSPIWRRQLPVHEGRVDRVALHFMTQPGSTHMQRPVANDSQPPPTLFIWMYLNGEQSCPSGKNGHRFADDIFSRMFLHEMFCILIKISRMFVPKIPLDNQPAMV